MTTHPPRSAADYLPSEEPYTLPVLSRAAARCRGCDLYRGATQTVFGEGPADARLMLVGEGPGETEDRQGRPFVGRAGALLTRVLQEVGVERERVYITNVVKHFPHEGERGRRRPRKPRVGEVRACLPWLEAELALVRPMVLVCLGATAAQAILGRDFRLTQQRGQMIATDWAPWTMATLHPAALLRMPPDRKDEALAQFKTDLTRAAQQAREG
ncbi:MAG TPA: UdgX family uracil-DNA binding protein [Phycisphaeraceae bacterium]